jgi:DNA-binding transcriptional LysR family regulator
MTGRLDDMVVFARVVEAGSLTRAAKALRSTRSAVSKSLARLEEHLGARLLYRTTRQLSPTAIGEACYAHCARISQEATFAEEAVSALRKGPHGRLRVSCSVALGLLLAPVFPRLTQRYSALSLELLLSDGVVDLVREGIDVAVRLGRMSDSSLVARKLKGYRRVLCASPTYLARHGAPRTADELSSHQCLVRAGQPHWQLERDGKPLNVPVQGRFAADTPELLRQAALSGLGIVMLPDFLVARDLAEKRLVPVLEAHAQPAGLFVVYPNAKQLSANVRAFVDFVSEAVRVIDA